MKIVTLSLILMLNVFCPKVTAAECIFNGTNLDTLNRDEHLDVEFGIKVPLPPDLFEILEKYFGKFSKKECENSIAITKIVNRKTSEYYFAFYTDDNHCDGGNSYGVIFKGGAENSQSPMATIEDSYIECL
jgi:hypothetical protein